MPYFAFKILLWIFTFKLILSQDKHGSPTFMTKIEDCSGDIMNNYGTEEKESEEDLKITFKLFTRQNRKKEYILKPNSKSVKNSTFNPCVDTIFIIHGYISSLPNYSAFFEIKDEVLKQGEFNAIVVDYSKYNDDSITTYFEGAFSYVPAVGSSIANMIKILMNVSGIKPESVYLIGQSLGAHVAGVAGQHVPKLGRITGLDTAGPFYRFLPKSSKLTRKDAIFVDAIHTNGAILVLKGLGTYTSYADQDYFPNGGSFQPGCVFGSTYLDTQNVRQSINSISTIISCNHNRALNLYIDSINNCEFLSVLCGSYQKFLKGKCSGKTSVTSRMGFHAEKINYLSKDRDFYLKTRKTPPYCIRKNNS